MSPKTYSTIIKQFEGINVKMLKVNGEILFEVYSTGIALGYAEYSNGYCFPRTERIDEIIESISIIPFTYAKQKFLKRTQLYDFMSEIETKVKCEAFKKWIINEVVPYIDDCSYIGINKSFSILSKNVRNIIKQELIKQNNELKLKKKSLSNEIENITSMICQLEDLENV